MKPKIEKQYLEKDFKDNYDAYQLNRMYGPLKHFCYAPHTSMFFSLHGKISPCYATYGNSPDKFGKVSIRDSWFNSACENIRKEHESFDYSDNCEFCNQLFKTGAFGSMLAKKYEHYAFNKSKYPQIMEFELSNRCNLECIMCDANLSSAIAKKQGLNAQVIDNYGDEFIEELKEFVPHLKMAEFTGGDPFLIEKYYQIWDLILELNPKCEILITTNANTMSERIEKLMSKTSKLHFNISFDAYSKDVYEQIRINANYENVRKNIDSFNAYCKKHKTSMNLLVCPLTTNSRELPKLIEFGNSLDVGVFFHTVVKPEDLSLKYQDEKYLNELIEYLGKFEFPRKTWNQRTNANNYSNLIVLLKAWRDEASNTKTQNKLEENPAYKLFYEETISQGTKEQKEKIEKLLALINSQDESDIIFSKLSKMNKSEIETKFKDLEIEDFISFVLSL
ncbi:MAG: radical SAM protein [Bacteroidales bacterium]|nr:radical SAM protein [Bacteroidales bacterium]